MFTVASSGTLTAVGPGLGVVTYTGSSCYITRTINVGSPLPAITGTPGMCVGSTMTMADAVSGGNWYSSATAKATVNTVTGVVTGVSAGTSTISSYKNGCTTTTPITVNSCGRIAENGGGGAADAGIHYTVYPNPTTSVLNILQSSPEDGMLPTLIMNQLGQTVYAGEVAMLGGKGALDVSNLVPGIYVVVFRTPDGGREQFKVVVE